MHIFMIILYIIIYYSISNVIIFSLNINYFTVEESLLSVICLIVGHFFGKLNKYLILLLNFHNI